MESQDDTSSPLDKAIENTFVSVVKIWLEESPTPDFPAAWRGHVRDVLHEDELYFQTLDELQLIFKQKIALWTSSNSYEVD
jgi:hypothetical protein